MKNNNIRDYLLKWGFPLRHVDLEKKDLPLVSPVVWKKVDEYIHNYKKNNRSLYLYSSSSSTGKTSLATYIVKKLCEKNLIKGFCKFWNVSRLIRKIKESYGVYSEVSTSQIFSELENCDVLVLDDMGSERMTSHVLSQLFAVVDHRFNFYKDIIFTSKIPLEKLYIADRDEDSLTSDSLQNRLMEMVEVIPFVEEDE